MRLRFAIIAVVLCRVSASAWAADDGFGAAGRIEGSHFTIYYKSGVDLNNLIGQLNISKTDEMLAGQAVDLSAPERRLASSLDVLFNRACSVLDMHVYSFKGSIKIFSTQQELAAFYDTLYHRELPCTGLSFYLYDFNSIYITAENFRREVLGHEIGHAVMSNYFVVQPSVKIQEVLAGYVEYQLRKSK